MGKMQRRKGAKGQTIAANMLRDRDWKVEVLTCGRASEDLIAEDSTGIRYSAEVKMTKAITVEHRKQAMSQAKDRGLPWMMLSHIEGTRSWLVQRQSRDPVVWHEKYEK